MRDMLMLALVLAWTFVSCAMAEVALGAPPHRHDYGSSGRCLCGRHRDGARASG